MKAKLINLISSVRTLMRSESNPVILVPYYVRVRLEEAGVWEEKILELFANPESNCSTVDRDQYFGYNI